MTTAPTPRVSIIIPVYNEEAILQTAVVDLIDRLREFDWTYELCLAENGSTDRTVAVGEELAKRFPQVSIASVGAPNYGLALRRGILAARGEFVICDEIDLCDTDFYRRALEALETGQADFVVGSKVMAGASDERPLFRRLGTVVINGMLRVALGFRGTDTHGLKAFRRASVVDVANACLVDKDLFASELVIRAERGGVRMLEIPVRVLEKRPPSIGLSRRVPNVLKNLARLFIAIRIRG
ncbi:MAG: glycosyltransferase [Sandaracinaceae bacterium]|jgi:glycosyltransferase involved in cell wall biosynthesis|nr:glycosyltransferase [Sandaracinaceae bacterium]MBK7153967.1 glycosyltransferase [Sandaracinaceae bacterium]MBK7776436.1 glycosyltransferase [Sandaracinaceae bacterium]MBK8408558.1 glycosyltransferase [Sandaracinaceae bacterium]MBK8590897.1 glycosyltransferase [Sandaracinaceae bacterium]